MALVFQRRLAIPLWAIAFFTLALTAPPAGTLFLMPPTTVFAIAAIGVAAIVFLMPGRIAWLRTSRAPVCVLPSKPRDQARPAITIVAETGVRTLAEWNQSTGDHVLGLVCIDDDGGSQRSGPPA